MTSGERKASAAAGVAIVAMIALLVTPFLFQRHTTSLRSRITSRLEPARDATADVRLALAREVGAIRGYLLTRDTALLAEYRHARVAEDDALARLSAIDVGDSMASARIGRLVVSAQSWNGRNDRIAAGDVPLAGFTDSLSTQQQRYRIALDDTELAAAAISDQIALLRQDIETAERRWAIATAGLVVIAMIAAALVWAILRSGVRAGTLARTDGLTGLHNRRGFEELARRELARAARHRTPVTLMLLDLDGFKRVNDDNGHAAGDEVLRATAGAIRAAIREIDVAARIGGDEFAILLPDNRAQPYEEVVKRIHSGVVDRIRAVQPGVGASTGAVTIVGEVPTVQSLLDRADQLLYDAKNAGKATTRHGIIP